MTPFHEIVVAVDGSEPAQHAADFAIRIGEGSRLIFVSVVDSSDETVAEARRIVEACTRKAKTARLHAGGLVVEGEPVDAILRTAEDLHADLIVLATHGRRGLARVVMGSVAEGVARRATIPVMFAPSGMGPDHPQRHLRQIFQGL